MPAISSFAIPAAISVGSSLLGSALTDTPDVPDLSGLAEDRLDDARVQQAEQAEQQANRVEENLAAQGASALGSSGTREEMFDAQASARAQLEGKAADIITDAIRKERMMEFQQDRRQAQNRARAISEIGQGLATSAIAAGVGEDGFGFGGDSGPNDDVVNFEGTGADRFFDNAEFGGGTRSRSQGMDVGDLIDMNQMVMGN